jgi:hypothetical protein
MNELHKQPIPPAGRGVPREKYGSVSADALERIDPASAVAVLAGIPAEEIWLASLDSERTRRAYKSDVGQFIAALGVRSSDELYAVTPPAVIAWRQRLGGSKEHGGVGPGAGPRKTERNTSG